MFQGKNEKLGFSWYHCKESMQKLTRQVKLSIKHPSEQSGNVGGTPSVTSRNNWDSALKWESWTVIICSLFFFSVIFVFQNRGFFFILLRKYPVIFSPNYDSVHLSKYPLKWGALWSQKMSRQAGWLASLVRCLLVLLRCSPLSRNHHC